MLKCSMNVPDVLKYVLPVVLFLSIGHGCTQNVTAGPTHTRGTSISR